jgi:glycosyltransferase involved in cell wall biosynthesis
MRFTFLTPSDNLTGGTRVIATYARELQRRGHEVCVVSNAPDRPSSWRQRLRDWRAPPAVQRGHIALSGVPHRVLERPRAVNAGDLPEADVLIATWWETAVWMNRMPASKGRKVHLVQGYEVWTGGDAVKQVQAALRLPNRKIAISEALATEIQGQVGQLGFAVVPNAVDLSLFDAPPRARQNPPTVGFIYARTPIKGSDLCAQAVELARQQIPDLRVLAFGVDTPTSAWPLPAGAEFTHCPAQESLASLYARCDAWFFASRLDSFGLPILEAMACRTPVIGVPIGAGPQLLSDGCGVLVSPESPLAMAQALVSLCQQPAAAWMDLSARAHRRAHSYSWSDATTLLLAAIDL